VQGTLDGEPTFENNQFSKRSGWISQALLISQSIYGCRCESNRLEITVSAPSK